jgi:predicted nucleic acid-binding protein
MSTSPTLFAMSASAGFAPLRHGRPPLFWIAGHARSRALIVVTGNRGEFDRVPGLQREDWG